MLNFNLNQQFHPIFFIAKEATLTPIKVIFNAVLFNIAIYYYYYTLILIWLLKTKTKTIQKQKQ